MRIDSKLRWQASGPSFSISPTLALTQSSSLMSGSCGNASSLIDVDRVERAGHHAGDVAGSPVLLIGHAATVVVDHDRRCSASAAGSGGSDTCHVRLFSQGSCRTTCSPIRDMRLPQKALPDLIVQLRAAANDLARNKRTAADLGALSGMSYLSSNPEPSSNPSVFAFSVTLRMTVSGNPPGLVALISTLTSTCVPSKAVSCEMTSSATLPKSRLTRAGSSITAPWKRCARTQISRRPVAPGVK